MTYRDNVDRTHSAPDVNDTTVDETLEGTYAGTEWPVKRIDEKNKGPEFKDTNPTGFYTAEIEENTSASPIRVIAEVQPATDLADGGTPPGQDEEGLVDDEDDNKDHHRPLRAR